MRQKKNDEKLDNCAALMAEGRRTVCAPVCDEEYLEKMTSDFWLPDLTDEKKHGRAFYLHYTKDAADGMIGVCHKTGEIGHLFVTEAARGRGYGAKMLDFARKKLPEHDHPTMGVINTNTRAIALYKRMGWRLTGTVLHRYDPAEEGTLQRYIVRNWRCSIGADRCFCRQSTILLKINWQYCTNERTKIWRNYRILPKLQFSTVQNRLNRIK